MTDSLPLVHVTGVAVLGDHKLRLLFEDGTVGDVSFEGPRMAGSVRTAAGSRTLREG